MTDRVNAFVVVLDKDYRDDDIESTLQAIGHIKGVAHIQAHIVDISQVVADSRAKQELTEKLYQLIKEINT